jgi:hypothetical protein
MIEINDDLDVLIKKEIHLLHTLGYKIWEIMNLTLWEKDLILQSYYEANKPNKEHKTKDERIREIYLKKRELKNAKR